MPPPQQAGEKVLSSGWLSKKARTNAFSSGKNWNRRYFLLVAPPPGARRGAFPTLRYFNSDAPASVSQPRGGVAVGPNAAVRVLDTEESLAEFDLPPKLLGKRLFVFQAKPGAADAATAKSTYVLEAESSAALQHWVAALTEAISKARHSGSMTGSGQAGVTSNAAVAYGNEGAAGDGALAESGGESAAPIRAFSGALERAGLVGPLGGPAIANLPGAVWETPAFIDLMADAMLTREAVERRRGALAAGGAEGALRPLVRSATDVGRALGQLAMPASAEEAEALGDARQALVGLGDLALACPAGSRDNKRFLAWIEEVVDRVRNTPIGRSLLLPGGWCTRAGGHPLVYAVRRHHGHYALLVTNCGDGLEYHPIEADPLLDGFRYAHTVVLDDVDPGTLMDASTWALLYRPLIFPAPGKKQSEHIYAKVLPLLNKRPLMASAYHERSAASRQFCLLYTSPSPRDRG